jgi:hypothetical protein
MMLTTLRDVGLALLLIVCCCGVAVAMLLTGTPGRMEHSQRFFGQGVILHELRIETSANRAALIRADFLPLLRHCNKTEFLGVPVRQLVLSGVSQARPTGVGILFFAEYQRPETVYKQYDFAAELDGLTLVEKK